MGNFSVMTKRMGLLRLLGCVITAIGILWLAPQGCSRQAVKHWHTKELTEEYTADRTPEIETFEKYLQLEDRLFEQLAQAVYAHTGSGPEFALVRYSRGSAADPQVRTPNWNRTFAFSVDAPAGGVLLLHGMSDSPYSLRALGEALHQRNYWVIGLRLPGHGTAPSGLTRVKWEDMAAAVALSIAHLTSKVGRKPIHIIGYSTGASLAVNFALDSLERDDIRVPASLVLLSPAVGIHPAAGLAQWKRRFSIVPGLGGLAWMQIEPEFDPYKYNSFATNAAEQVHRLTTSVARRISSRARAHPDNVLPPTLVFKSTVDATVSTDAVIARLLGKLAPHRHELVLFDINRSAAYSSLLVSDPGPLTTRLMDSRDLPFTVTFITNENPKSTAVVARRQRPFSSHVSAMQPLGMQWPMGVLSLSHVALPFPPDDPLYGQYPPGEKDRLFLGRMAVQGERGLLKLPESWFMRLRHNPFYGYLEKRVHAWVDAAR